MQRQSHALSLVDTSSYWECDRLLMFLHLSLVFILFDGAQGDGTIQKDQRRVALTCEQLACN